MCGVEHVCLESIGAVEAILATRVGYQMVRLGVAFADRATEGLFVERVGIDLYGGYAVAGGEGLERGQ